MNQQQLFRTGDPITSREAAEHVGPRIAESQRIVLNAFRRHAPMDDRLLIAIIGGQISDSRARGARCELARAGQLVECGYTATVPRRRLWKLKATA